MLTISKEAMKRISLIRSTKGKGYLRITVDGGGCSGFSYSFNFDTKNNNSNDIIAIKDNQGNAAVVTDEMSMNYINGSKLIWKEDLSGANFIIDNPNATSSCGCGTSFSIS